MIKLKFAGLGVSLLFTACAETSPSPEPITISSADRATLSSLGVASVTYDGAAYVLTDRDGTTVGSVRVEGARISTRLGAHAYVAVASAGALDLECDGSGVSVARQHGDAKGSAQLAACHDAMTVQSVVLASLLPTDSATTGSVSQSLVGGGGCQWLGCNVYCNGADAVYSIDYLCDTTEGEEYLESDTYYFANSEFFCGAV